MEKKKDHEDDKQTMSKPKAIVMSFADKVSRSNCQNQQNNHHQDTCDSRH
jgi:hypothetical protein